MKGTKTKTRVRYMCGKASKQTVHSHGLQTGYTNLIRNIKYLALSNAFYEGNITTKKRVNLTHHYNSVNRVHL